MEYKIQPWAHQLEAIERASKLPGFAFFFEMGAGKTATCINTIRKVWNEKKRQPRVLIFCPPIVVDQWKDEWLKNSNLKPSDIIMLKDSGHRRKEKLIRNGFIDEKNLAGEKVPKVFITNYESLGMDAVFEAMLAYDAEVIVFDESHRLKNVAAVRSKKADKLVHQHAKPVANGKAYSIGRRPYVYLLTGTPTPNSLIDIFQQFKVLDGGATFGSNFYAFKNTYMRDMNTGMPRNRYFPNYVPKPNALAEIAAKIAPISMRVLKKDCMDLPPFIRTTIPVEMSPEQEVLYKSMLKDYIAFFKDPQTGLTTTSAATLAITKGMRLMQIASGYIKDVDGKEFTITPEWTKGISRTGVEHSFTPKQKVLAELLEELTPDHKVLIWCVWKKNYEQIREVCNHLKIQFLELHGDIPDSIKQENVKRFNNSKEIRVMFGHPRSGGIGVNLTEASYSIFFSRSFSKEEDEQAEARNYRGGSNIHEKITRIDLVTKDTIEEKVVEVLAKKEVVSEKILREITLGQEKLAKE